MRTRLGVVIAVTFVVIGCTANGQPSSSPAAGSTASPLPVLTEPASIPPSSSAPASTEPSQAAALAWQKIAQNTGGDVVGFAGGYVALDSQGNGSNVLYSADGRTWTSVALPFRASKDPHGIPLEANAMGIAADGPEVIVVGGYGHVPCTPQAAGETGAGPACPSSPISWLSSDGTHWQTSFPWRGPGAPKGFSQGNAFSTVWAVPTGGWDAAAEDVAGEAGAAGGIFHSTDGLSWAALPSSPPTTLKEAPNPTELWDVGLADQSGRRLVAGYWYPTGDSSVVGLFTTVDGQKWTAVDTFQGANATVESGVTPDPNRSSLWMLAGADAMSLPTVWTSPDLNVWTAHHLPTALSGAQGSLSAIAETHLGYVALGSLSDGTDGNAYHSSWLSSDGIAWVQLATPGTSGDDGPDVLADGPAGVIGFAQYNGSDVPPGVWLLK